MKKRKQKTIKIWNGRGYKGIETFYIGAYSRADACRMLNELYPHISVSQWNREITIYFSFGCWGNSMEGIKPSRGVWASYDKWGNEIPKRIYPKEATCQISKSVV